MNNRCICCLGDDITVWKNVNQKTISNSYSFFYGGFKFIESIGWCNDCGYGHQYNFDEKNIAFYEEFGAGYNSTSIQRKRYASDFWNLINYSTELDKNRLTSVLDIGSGDGALLDALDLPIDKFAVESSLSLASSLEKRGIKLVEGGDLKQPFGKFDVVLMHDLLEHVTDPSATISASMKSLNDNGKAIICVPDYGRMLARILREKYYLTTPMHIGYFNETALSKLASRHSSKFKIFKAPAVHASLKDALKWLPFLKNMMPSTILGNLSIHYRSNIVLVLEA